MAQSELCLWGVGVPFVPWITTIQHQATGVVRVKVNPKYFRPAEVEFLLGNPAKAKEKLGWVPEITFEALCAEMVAADVELMKANPTA